MSDQNPSFFARIFLAWVAYFRTLFDGEFAAGVVRLRSGQALPAEIEEEEEEEEPESEPPPSPLKEASPEAALQLLALFQREGRLIDFLNEDVADFSDEEIGAAARVVHEGAKKALDEHFTIVAVHDAEEGARVTVEEGFDATAIRLTGNVVGKAPYKGELAHKGWRATEVRLPKMSAGHDPEILAPAEVEL